ncbi:HAD family phosphatase [Micromonospora sp. KC721]|uniref:HAD family hydrolase n=1 Tax=Micromonospora sp. KC721 TaxID=2530380 RepID=UPI00104C429A|nr:HAD family phosphatase [Micromonospora sp. KC721]TDB82291.1 HAD family phosphatase [Micromonospora sp. KC721]
MIKATSAADLEPACRHEALLFDWDGTLADSQSVNFQVLRAALEPTGVVLEQPWFDARTGMSTREMVALLAAAQDVMVDTEVVAGRRDAAYLQRAHEVGEIEVVTSVLRNHRSHRKTALATGGARQTVTATAAALRLFDLFDVVVTREDVERGKPAPDLFLLAAERLGVAAGQCLVYEDSDEGLAAAADAGMDAIDVRPLRLLT